MAHDAAAFARHRGMVGLAANGNGETTELAAAAESGGFGRIVCHAASETAKYGAGLLCIERFLRRDRRGENTPVPRRVSTCRRIAHQPFGAVMQEDPEGVSVQGEHIPACVTQ